MPATNSLSQKDRNRLAQGQRTPRLRRRPGPPPSHSDASNLIGSHCRACGGYFFPRRPVCPECRGEETEDVRLSRKGRLETFVIIRQAPPGYRGPLPYAIGALTLPEGIRLRAFVGGGHPEELRTGMDVDLDLLVVCEDR